MKFKFLSDVTNDNFKLKSTGTLIQRGEVVEYEEGKIPNRVEQLIKLGVVEKVEQEQPSENLKELEQDPYIDEEKLQAIVDLNAKDAIDTIDNGELLEMELHALYTLEQETKDKNRSTVLKEIQEQLERLKEADEE